MSPCYYDPKNPNRRIIAAAPKNPQGPLADLIRAAGREQLPAVARKIREQLTPRREQTNPGEVQSGDETLTLESLTPEGLTPEGLTPEGLTPEGLVPKTD